MTLIPKTEEQRTEMIARLIYLLSGLRAWQREGEEYHPNKMKDPDTAKWEWRVDEFLKNIGAVDHESLKDLIGQLTIKHQ